MVMRKIATMQAKRQWMGGIVGTNLLFGHPARSTAECRLRQFRWYASTLEMSTQDILEELPKLNPAELETVYRRAVELHQGLALEASPELLAAIDEADESIANEGGVELAEARRIVESWGIK
jgi:hypothetical protein